MGRDLKLTKADSSTEREICLKSLWRGAQGEDGEQIGLFMQNIKYMLKRNKEHDKTQ